MKKVLITLSLLSILIFQVSAQEKESRNLNDFHSLKIGGAMEVELIPGNQNRIEFSYKNLASEDLFSEVKNGVLNINLKKGNSYNNIEIKAKLYFKSLKAIDVSGAVELYTKSRIKSPSLQVNSSGAVKMTLIIDTESLSIVSSGANNLKMSGSAKTQAIDLRGACNYRAYDLKSQRASIEVKGVGNADIYVSETLTAKVMGMGNINFKGSPKTAQVEKKGMGNINAQE